MSFSDFTLAPPILKAVNLCGYSAPTPIQEQAIPKAMAGHDLIASAPTGTGKTAAFMLPALSLLTAPSTASSKSRGPRVLVLTPTRELANQITESIHIYGKFMKIRSGAILGGMPYNKQEKLLSRPVDMIVATPGRLIDHMKRGRINFSRLELLVLDEADRMLDIGFSEAVKTIAAATPPTRQTLLFTATWNKGVEKLSRYILKKPVRVEITGKKVTLEEIEQRIYTASRSDKNRILKHLLTDKGMTRAIIFSATKVNADNLARELNSHGHSAAALHGDMTQNARNRTTMNMRRGRIRLLVATDVASRGLDLTGVTHVINYDLPLNGEDYVHRIGRTGRAGASGIAISLASYQELGVLHRIERYIGQTLPRFVIPGEEPARTVHHSKGNGGKRSQSARNRGENGNGQRFGKKLSSSRPFGSGSKGKADDKENHSRHWR